MRKALETPMNAAVTPMNADVTPMNADSSWKRWARSADAGRQVGRRTHWNRISTGIHRRSSAYVRRSSAFPL
jgi:hypothetical protein